MAPWSKHYRRNDRGIQPVCCGRIQPMAITAADLLVGAAIGTAGGMQGIALPGLLLVGLGFDASVAAVRAMDPQWFPNHTEITLEDVLVTAIGTALGWGAAKLILPQINKLNPGLAKAATAGVAMLPIAGRFPGRLRAIR